MLVINVRANDFFENSYQVNSANQGPYGDAIVKELIPAVETAYRGIGQGWARGLMGGSTGGWEAFAYQIFYPDDFNMVYANCPDSLTFSSLMTTDIYKSANDFYYDDPWLQRDRPAIRDTFSSNKAGFEPGRGPKYVDARSEIVMTMKELNHQEYSMGTHSRSCGQLDMWESTFSSACPDGFPCRLYKKLTGEINHTVAEHWKEHYDFAHILKRDWQTLGPKLQGKLNINVGGSDSVFLQNAILDLQETAVSLGSDAKIVFGAHNGLGFQHCFSGYVYDVDGAPLPNSVTDKIYLQTFLPRMAERFVATAPDGADVRSWRY